MSNMLGCMHSASTGQERWRRASHGSLGSRVLGLVQMEARTVTKELAVEATAAVAKEPSHGSESSREARPEPSDGRLVTKRLSKLFPTLIAFPGTLPSYCALAGIRHNNYCSHQLHTHVGSACSRNIPRCALILLLLTLQLLFTKAYTYTTCVNISL